VQQVFPVFQDLLVPWDQRDLLDRKEILVNKALMVSLDYPELPVLEALRDLLVSQE
jgi:hypothetical protein